MSNDIPKPIAVGIVAMTALTFVALAVFAALLVSPTGECGPWNERGTPIEGSDAECQRVYDVAHTAFPDADLSTIWVEWVDRVEDTSGRHVAGTITHPYGLDRIVARVSRLDRDGRPWTARDSALAHEILLHALSEVLGRGANPDHRDQELQALYAR